MELNLYSVGECYPELCGFYGSKLHITEHGLQLFISYDDLSEDEVTRFCSAGIEISFKKFGLPSIFMFKFQDYLIDAPFNLFETAQTWENWIENKKKLVLELLLCDYSTGEVYGKRVEKLPSNFCESWLHMLSVFYEMDRSRYIKELFQFQLLEIYDNHTVDGISEMFGEQTLACIV